VITPLPGAIPTKPGSATLPFFGIRPSILDAKSGQIISQQEAKGLLVIDQPWPGIARTLYGNHARYLAAYMNPYFGHYFTGDECYRDKDGYYWIIGRVDGEERSLLTDDLCLFFFLMCVCVCAYHFTFSIGGCVCVPPLLFFVFRCGKCVRSSLGNG
jgi:hypothetical protein